ncbi:hypothetical protein Purlil1_2037 [Purpureocillium lilacinum]|uniref:Uncharacterized protein n=1 Tax=Purpureocillium lilacinum TaxID=33203 RepID=A0ABR0CBC6_PURLI|nr:hypothetical protein Purlil1_2037 [Purpureocillium lilacinum]
MHLAASLIAFGSLAATAAAAAAPDFVFPDPVLLQRRQAGDVSDENYKCHENCESHVPDYTRSEHTDAESPGYAIQQARTKKDTYCKDSEWLGYFNGCMKCAIAQDIWKGYGKSVTAAAKGCGLEANPDQPSSAAPSSAAPTTSAAATTPAQQTTAVTSAQATTGAQQPSTQSSAAPSSTAPGAMQPSATSSGVIVPTASGTAPSHSSNGTASASPSSVTVSGGSQTLGSSFFVAGVAALVAAAWF